MILFFRKRFIKEEKSVDRMASKIRRSESVKQEYKENEAGECDMEIYKLDNMDVYFNLGDPAKNSIIIKNKKGRVIFTMDCHYDPCDQMQIVRAGWFSKLLKTTRNTYNSRCNEAKKLQEGVEKVSATKAEQ